MNGKFGLCFPRGEKAAILGRYPFFSPCVQCFRVSIPPALRLGLLFYDRWIWDL